MDFCFSKSYEKKTNWRHFGDRQKEETTRAAVASNKKLKGKNE